MLDGVVALTPPGGGASIDLGPHQGWRQPADPAVAPTRLEMAVLPTAVDRAQPVRWHLPDVEPADPAAPDWSLRPVGAAQAQSSAAARDGALLSERSSAPRRAGRGNGWLGAWLDHQTSVFTILLIAIGGLVILALPAVMLGQNLRAQWQNRPASKGRRRRSLTHG